MGSLEDKIKKLAKQVNDSLYRLEKAELQEESKEYQIVQHYAIDKNSDYYNVNLEKGTIRVTKDLKRFKTRADLYRYKETLENIMNAQTRTVSGTRKAMQKAYEKFLQSEAKASNKNMTFDEYRKVFKIYRTKILADGKEHLSSDTVVDLLEHTNIYELSDSAVRKALTRANESGTAAMLDEYFKKNKTGKFVNTGKIRRRKRKR